MPASIHPARLQALNRRATSRGQYVLYWMQQSQRAEYNHALEFAAARANALKLPLIVGFGLTANYPEANLRHYVFMLEGLAETERALRRRNIQFVLRIGEPPKIALTLGRAAAEIVCDRGYLRWQKMWREEVARRARCRVTQVESDVVVPVHLASSKSEYGARTLRPKLLRQYEELLALPASSPLGKSSLRFRLPTTSLHDIDALCRRLRLDRSVGAVTRFFRGGTGEAKRRFRAFLRHHFSDYREHRNQPQTDEVSHMSKYLHFGQISPAWLLREVRKQRKAGRANVYTFVDELLVRRELAMNWCEFNPDYDRYAALPSWARQTLAEHARDRREHIYPRDQLERGETHDPYWNAAMREMRMTGYMHNYMRMYWGKKILEWSRTPEQAFATALAINNKFFLDGRDPNSYANIAWIFGQHDRPWPERSSFGKVRYMNAAGLERKCDIDGYVAKVGRLTAGSEDVRKALESH